MALLSSAVVRWVFHMPHMHSLCTAHLPTVYEVITWQSVCFNSLFDTGYMIASVWFQPKLKIALTSLVFQFA